MSRSFGGSFSWRRNAELNCAWFPERRRNSTSRRATAIATRWPWSSSTIDSVRSMPVVIPADVQTPRSLTKMPSSTTWTAG